MVVATTISRSVYQFYGDIIKEFKGRGYVVHVVTSPGPEVEHLRSSAGTVHEIPMRRDVAIWADVRALLAWIRVLRKVKPRLVFAGTPKAALLGMLSAALLRVPERRYFLQGLRLEGVQGARSALLATVERVTSACSQAVIAVSPSLSLTYQALRLNVGRPVHVAHHGSSHGVDARFYAPCHDDKSIRHGLGLDLDTATVVFLGRITRDKGLDVLCRALDMVRAGGVDVQLLALGALDEPDSRQHQEDILVNRPWARVVHHVEDVRPYIATAQMLVLPTRREGFPNVVLEAAAMGLPAVTTTATGARDSVVNGVTGLVVPVEDATALAGAITRLILDADECRRMGVAARARVLSDFRPADVARAIVDLCG